MVQASDIVGDKTCRTPPAVEDLHLHLAPVGVTREGQFDAELGGARKRVGIVREQYVGRVAPHQPLNAHQLRLTPARVRPLALIIHTYQIDGDRKSTRLNSSHGSI